MRSKILEKITEYTDKLDKVFEGLTDLEVAFILGFYIRAKGENESG